MGKGSGEGWGKGSVAASGAADAWSEAIDSPRSRPALGRSAPLPIPEPADDEDLRVTDDREAPRPLTARRTLPRSSSLPRAGRWRQTEEIPAAEQPSVAPPMSDDVRRKVRERLDAQMLRLAESKKLPVRRPAPRRMAKPENQLDLEAERRRTEQELALRYEQMQKQTWYELLRVPTDASVGAIRDAYKHTAKRLDPNRATVGSDSHAARMLAEKIYLLATRALTTLTNPEARLEYDRRLGIDDGPRIAAHFVADEAFERGKRALAVDALEDAANAFHDAYGQCPDEPLYIAYLAWVRYALRPDDAEVREQTIEVLSRVLQDAPHAEDVLAFLGTVARKHGDKPNATAAYQRLLALDPDHPEALAAMRELSPPPAKKGGLLSRYFAG
ncbi:MAG: DnaJ domain-containing protein [Deltaproteobacteria bacterium]